MNDVIVNVAFLYMRVLLTVSLSLLLTWIIVKLDSASFLLLFRTVPDQREEECRYWDYPTELPTASVILVFHNEVTFDTFMLNVSL